MDNAADESATAIVSNITWTSFAIQATSSSILTTTGYDGRADARLIVTYIFFGLGGLAIIVSIILIIFFIVRQRSRAKHLEVLRRRQSHLRQYHLRGNDIAHVYNTTVTGTGEQRFTNLVTTNTTDGHRNDVDHLRTDSYSGVGPWSPAFATSSLSRTAVHSGIGEIASSQSPLDNQLPPSHTPRRSRSVERLTTGSSSSSGSTPSTTLIIGSRRRHAWSENNVVPDGIDNAGFQETTATDSDRDIDPDKLANTSSSVRASKLFDNVFFCRTPFSDSEGNRMDFASDVNHDILESISNVDVNDLTYRTYDRDYFRERTKPLSVFDANLSLSVG